MGKGAQFVTKRRAHHDALSPIHDGHGAALLCPSYRNWKYFYHDVSSKYSFFPVLLLLYSLPVLADVEDLLFADVSRQSHDYSCGPAALSTLINGTIEGPSVSELEVIVTREASEEGDEEGFSLLDLQQAAGKLGRRAEWRKIAPEILPRLSQPVILLTGLNSPFPHFVVLKGFRDQVAFLADPSRGNIRVPYDALIAEGIDARYPAWYVMAIDTPVNDKKRSSLYLSGATSDLIDTHFTVEQADIITLVTIARPNQLFVTYGYRVSQGRNATNGFTVKSRGDAHNLDVSYGIGDDTEVGGGVSYSDTTYSASGFSEVKASNRNAYLFVSWDFDLDALDDMGVVLGSTLSHDDEYAAFDLGASALAYGRTDFGQWMARGGFYKKLKEKAPGDVLPKYGISWLLGINKPLTDRSLGTFYVTLNTERNDGEPDVEFNHYYSANASVSWTMNKRVQLRPSLGYVFGGRVMKTFSAGMDITYVGGW